VAPAGRALAFVFGTLFSILILFLSAWILHLLLRPWSQALIARPMRSFWWHTLWGFISLIIIPVVAIILLVTVVGIPLGLLVLFSYFILLILSYLTAPVIMGSLLYSWWKGDRKASTRTTIVNWKSILLGVIVFTLLSYIPVIGWLINGILMLTALGTFVRSGTERYQAK
jgi:hypothetical protein